MVAERKPRVGAKKKSLRLPGAVLGGVGGDGLWRKNWKQGGRVGRLIDDKFCSDRPRERQQILDGDVAELPNHDRDEVRVGAARPGLRSQMRRIQPEVTPPPSCSPPPCTFLELSRPLRRAFISLSATMLRHYFALSLSTGRPRERCLRHPCGQQAVALMLQAAG